MYSITSGICAGTSEECGYFPQFYPVHDVGAALAEIHQGHDVILVEDDWVPDAKRILMGLGATPDWAEDVVSRAVEFRRVAA